MGVFIRIELNADRLTREEAAGLVPACPVDIFALRDDKVVVRPEKEDECTLCELCLEAAPAGAIRIVKLYKSEVLVSRKPVDA